MPVTVCAQHQGLSLVALNGVSLRKKGTLLMGFIAYESVAGAPVTTDAAGARVSSPASRTTRGKDHPTACLSGLGAGQVWHRAQELAGRAWKRLPCGGANHDARSPSRDSKNAIAWPAPRTQPACAAPFTSSNSPAMPHHTHQPTCEHIYPNIGISNNLQLEP